MAEGAQIMYYRETGETWEGAERIWAASWEERVSERDFSSRDSLEQAVQHLYSGVVCGEHISFPHTALHALRIFSSSLPGGQTQQETSGGSSSSYVLSCNRLTVVL